MLIPHTFSAGRLVRRLVGPVDGVNTRSHSRSKSFRSQWGQSRHRPPNDINAFGDKRIYPFFMMFASIALLRNIVVVPLACESLGTRSMCTYVETPDVKMVLDAGVSLCPVRFGLPPHPLEFNAIVDARHRIAEAAEKARVVTISHYHFDHHTPSYEDWWVNWTEKTVTAKQIYEGKEVLLKNPKEHINSSQRYRAWMFQRTGGKYAKKLEVADGKTFVFNETVVKFSKPVFHGSDNSFLGWVLMTLVEYKGERFLFAPDVQGPMSASTLTKILKWKPQVLMVGGPPLYLDPLKVSHRDVQMSLGNLSKIVEAVPQVILEHHLLRDEAWKSKIESVLNNARQAGHDVVTSAEFLRKANVFLESSRRQLYETHEPSQDFRRWRGSSQETKKHTKPPI
jgi:predicted metallo-beta-lactamase superfamily hydrolase